MIQLLGNCKPTWLGILHANEESSARTFSNAYVCCALLFATISLLFAGCQSTGIRAHQLPPEYRSTSRKRTEDINFAKVAVPGASESLIAVRDLLEITVSTGRDDEKNKPFMARVADDGSVDVPVIGPVPVAGMEVFEAGQNIVTLARQRGMYRHPLVTVEIESKAVNRITVLGAVSDPGVHEIPRGNCDLMSALAASGGLTKEASTEVEIIRQPQFGLVAAEPKQNDPTELNSQGVELAAYQTLPDPAAKNQNGRRSQGWSAPQSYRFDLANGQMQQGADFRLVDRDVIRIVPRKKEVIHVAGLVNKSGQFELPADEDIHLLDAIAMAGGKSSPVADKVLIIRQLENQSEPVIIQASLSKAKKDPLENLQLTSGDSISLEQTPATAVVDTIGRFFRLSFGVASSTVF